MQTIACVAACQIDEAFAANLQQIRKMHRSEDNSTGPLAAHNRTSVLNSSSTRVAEVHGSRTHPRPGSWPSNRFEDGEAHRDPSTSRAREPLL